MKIFHLSDLHIGLKLMNHDLYEDQKYILDQVVEIAEREKPDVFVVAGDIYDKAIPSAEAVTLFDAFLAALKNAIPKAVIMMISGNHDSAPRIDCYRQLLCGQSVYMIGEPPKEENEYIEMVTMEDEYGKLNFYLLPFVKPSIVKKIVGVDENGNNLSYNESVRRLILRENVNQEERNVLVSHQFYLPLGNGAEDVERMDSEVRTVGDIDEVCSDILQRFDYAALGHIHKPMKVGSELYRYCGTPLACSVSEAEQEKGIVVVEMKEKGNVATSVLKLKPLREVRVVKGTLEEVLKKGCSDYVTVILTDKVDLDVLDMQERIRMAFPNLLEIRRENQRRPNYQRTVRQTEKMDPFELCCSFIKDIREEEKMLLQDVIHSIQEA